MHIPFTTVHVTYDSPPSVYFSPDPYISLATNLQELVRAVKIVYFVSRKRSSEAGHWLQHKKSVHSIIVVLHILRFLCYYHLNYYITWGDNVSVLMVVHVPVVSRLLLELSAEQGGCLFYSIEGPLQLAHPRRTGAPPACEEVELYGKEKDWWKKCPTIRNRYDMMIPQQLKQFRCTVWGKEGHVENILE